MKKFMQLQNMLVLAFVLSIGYSPLLVAEGAAQIEQALETEAERGGDLAEQEGIDTERTAPEAHQVESQLRPEETNEEQPGLATETKPRPNKQSRILGVDTESPEALEKAQNETKANEQKAINKQKAINDENARRIKRNNRIAVGAAAGTVAVGTGATVGYVAYKKKHRKNSGQNQTQQQAQEPVQEPEQQDSGPQGGVDDTTDKKHHHKKDKNKKARKDNRAERSDLEKRERFVEGDVPGKE